MNATGHHHTADLPRATLLEAGEVADLLRKPRGWVYDMVEAGELPAIRVGRQLRFDPHEIGRWIDARRVGGPR